MKLKINRFSTFYIDTNGTSHAHYGSDYLSLDCSQSPGSGGSTINWTLTKHTGSSYYITGPTSVSINGQQVYYSGRVSNYNTFPMHPGSVSGSMWVDHSSAVTINVSITTAIYYSSGGTASGDWTLDAIVVTPTLNTLNITQVNETQIAYSCSVADNGGSGITDYYVDIFSDSGLTNKVGTNSGSLTGAFSGLSPNTQYYLRANSSNGYYRGYSNVASSKTYQYPYVSSVDSWLIGDSTKISFYNPLGRQITYYLNVDSETGTNLVSGTTTGNNVTITPDSAQCLSTVTSGYSKTAYAYCTYGSIKLTGSTTTYSIDKVTGFIYLNNISIAVIPPVSITVGDSLKFAELTNKSGASYKLRFKLSDDNSEILQESMTLTSDQLITEITNYLGSSKTSDTYTISIATLNYSGEPCLYFDITGTVYLTASKSSPTFTEWTYKDSNSATTAITGDNQIIVQGCSIPEVMVSVNDLPVPKYGATMSYYIISIGSVSSTVNYSSTGLDYIGTKIEDMSGLNNMSISAYDSRGFHTDVEKSIVILPYLKPQDSSQAKRTNGFDNETTLSISGKYSIVYKQDGTTKINTIKKVVYRYKVSTETTYNADVSCTFTLGSSSTSTTDSNTGTYKVSDIVLDLDNSNSYTMQVEVTDAFGNIDTGTITISQGVPIVFFNSENESVGVGNRNLDGDKKSINASGSIYAGTALYINGTKTLWYENSVAKVSYDLFNYLYPIGTLYENYINDKNPNEIFGYGTWELFAKGRVTVGIDTSDSDFNTIGKTGGSKYLQAHTHAIYPYNDDFNNSASGQPYGTTHDGASAKYTNSVFSTESAGTGDSGNLQPYVVTYKWIRTA